MDVSPEDVGELTAVAKECTKALWEQLAKRDFYTLGVGESRSPVGMFVSKIEAENWAAKHLSPGSVVIGKEPATDSEGQPILTKAGNPQMVRVVESQVPIAIVIGYGRFDPLPPGDDGEGDRRFTDEPCFMCGHTRAHHGAIKTLYGGRQVNDTRRPTGGITCSGDCRCPEFFMVDDD